MLKHLNVLELGGIAGRGGSLEVNGAQFNASELGGIAARLKHGATLKVYNCQKFNSLELGGIAARAPGQVTFTGES